MSKPKATPDGNAYYQGVDTLGVVEAHVKQVLKLNDAQAKDILKVYREVRQELRDRLDVLPGGTFKAQHLRAVLVQVDGAIQAMQAHLSGKLDSAAMEMAKQGVQHMLAEIEALQGKYEDAITPIDLNVVQVAHDTKTLLVRKYETTLHSYSEDLKKDLTRQLTQAAIQEKDYSEVVQSLSKYFLGEEWKLHRLVRTELHHVYNLAKVGGMKEVRQNYLKNLKKALIHPMDDRTGEDSRELAIENPIIDIDQPFVQTFKSSPKAKPVRYEFMVPPDRPNDRAVVVPYREEWDE